MDELRRSIDELLLLYKLEPETKDIFVEGITDKRILERFIIKNKLVDVKVIQTHEVDFKALTSANPSIKSNNRGKLIALNSMLETTFSNKLEGVMIIIDKDFDEATNNLKNGKYLKYTDYNSLELYLYNSWTLDIFYSNYLHSFPINGKQTLDKFEPILLDKFFIRLAISHGNIPNDKFTPFHKSIVISKENLGIVFSAEEHMRKILNNANKMSELQNYLSAFNKSKPSEFLDAKQFIRGHDFIDLFFLFINKIKNHIGLTLETLERSLFLCIDYSKLKNEHLFDTIVSKYS